ncbi:hypothetical protein HHUSO_G6776 [Huso huso]|uniref:Uncharacterized protein n=1 Tax=Huso huso TaxID=61971 RepID=A0ABR0ZYF9_HUSHU
MELQEITLIPLLFSLQAETSSNAISSTDQNYLLLLALKTKHQLTNEALEDILKLLNHIGGDGTVPASKYYFEKYFSDCKGVIDIYLICETCEMLLGIKATSGNCSFCGKQWVASHNISKGQFFFYMPLKSQIKALLNDISVQKHLAFHKERSTTGNYSDIQDGTLYKKVLNSSPSNTLSVNFSCDGVPVFKSSQYSIWPVLCVLNELPPVERLKHVLMASLWFGSKKPDMNLYLQPFVNECQDLMQSGVDWENAVTQEKINSKVVCTVAICDSVARPLLQNMMQFNGLHGCGFCTDPGTNVPKGRGMTRAYPYKKDFVLRSSTETIEQTEHAFLNKKTVCGVKGPSILMCIPNFDIIDGFIPDYMHCALLGVARQMMRLWVESKYHRYPFYLGTQVERIDSRLLPIKPPSNISRIPRSVTQYKFWKAHEWFAWLVFYSVPVLKGILQEKYFLHWCLLVEGIAILTSQSISEEQLYHCEWVFIHFVVLTEKLFFLYHCEQFFFSFHFVVLTEKLYGKEHVGSLSYIMDICLT